MTQFQKILIVHLWAIVRCLRFIAMQERMPLAIDTEIMIVVNRATETIDAKSDLVITTRRQ